MTNEVEVGTFRLTARGLAKIAAHTGEPLADVAAAAQAQGFEVARPMIGVLNAHMTGTPTEVGEHVDWSAPDLFTVEEFVELLGDPAEYAAASPHMIVFETADR